MRIWYETPAGTTSTPTSSPKLNADKIVQDAIDQLTVGKILFNVPEEMEVGKTERVEVRIAKTITKDFAINLKGTGKSKIENIKFATVTEVELKGNNDDISINPISTGSQLIGEKEYSEWSWDVTPKKSGEQTLSLIVNARIKIPQLEIDSVKKYPVEVKKIKVKVNPIHSIKDFLKDKWTDRFPLIFGPASVAGIVGWVMAKRKKSKKSNTRRLSSNRAKSAVKPKSLARQGFCVCVAIVQKLTPRLKTYGMIEKALRIFIANACYR